jgi:hypothetical protein
MKKAGILILIVSLILINLIYAEVRINEVELNPVGTDTGQEWVELYSDSLINLDGWKLVNHDNKVLPLNQSFNGYLVINFKEQWLDNENESIVLYNGNSLVSMTPVLKDSSNDNKTWNYCNDKWLFLIPSSGLANNCGTQSNSTNNQTNPNPTNNTTNSTNSSSNATISLDLDWDEDDIVNGKDFDITVTAYNLQDKEYDIKVSISYDSKVISQTYDENEKWVSSSEYYSGFFKGPGNQSEDITLRIKDSYRDFKGDADIIVRIREKGASLYKKEKQDNIEILKSRIISTTSTNTNSEGTLVSSESTTQDLTDTNSDSESENIIMLGKTIKESGTEDIKTSKNTIYQSKNEIIKTYSIYLFAVLLIGLCVLLAIKKI